MLPEHQMALITSDCGATRTEREKHEATREVQASQKAAADLRKAGGRLPRGCVVAYSRSPYRKLLLQL